MASRCSDGLPMQSQKDVGFSLTPEYERTHCIGLLLQNDRCLLECLRVRCEDEEAQGGEESQWYL